MSDTSQNGKATLVVTLFVLGAALGCASESKVVKRCHDYACTTYDTVIVGDRREPVPDEKPSLNERLREAAVSGNEKLLDSLIAEGADVNFRGIHGTTHLMGAAGGGNLEMARLLISRQADVNARDEWGGTALIGAASNGHLEIAKLLIQNGARVNEGSNSGRTPLAEAIDNHRTEMVEFLKMHGAR